MIDWQNKIRQITNRLEHLPEIDLAKASDTKDLQPVTQVIAEQLETIVLGNEKTRISEEFLGTGPLQVLMEDPNVTEIMVNRRSEIWFEKFGLLHRHDDYFITDLSYRQFLNRLSQEANIQYNLEKPFADGRWRDFRVHLISPPLHQDCIALNFRRVGTVSWNFQKLKNLSWAPDQAFNFLQNIISDRASILIVGNTGAGKTAVLNAFLQELKDDERAIIIEDTDELFPPNKISLKLLTRQTAQKLLPDVTMNDLLKQSLRMRPDRLIVGEVRGPEAKDLLLALATGHHGSFGTLHADDPQQALMRLEMLVQMGMPEWNLETVRRLILLGIQFVVLVGRAEGGNRYLKGIYRLSGVESFGFLLHPEYEAFQP